MALRSFAWKLLVGKRFNDSGQPEYIGGPSCKTSLGALIDLLGEGPEMRGGWLISSLDTYRHGDHALLIETTAGDVVIRGGLTSGYNGEGTRALAGAIKLLDDRGCYIADAVVPRDVLLRARHCALSERDLALIRSGGDVRRGKHFTYYLDAPFFREKEVWRYGRGALPLAILHPSLRPTVGKFQSDPDMVLRNATRELEYKVKSRLRPGADRSEGHRETAFWNAAFVNDDSYLRWPDLSRAETLARAKLFEGAFGTIRNPRAHRPDVPDDYAFEELFLVSMLMTFLDEAEDRDLSHQSAAA